MISTSKPMRAGLVSRMALGAALTLGVLAGATTPAMAKEKPAKQAPIKLSPAFQKLALPVQKALEDAKTNPAIIPAVKAQVEQLFAAAATPDDKFVAGQFAVSLGSTAQDQALQRKGVLAMLESGKAAPSEQAKLNFYAGQFAYAAKDYVAARTGVEAAIRGGYTENDPQTLLAEIYLAEGNTAQGLTVLQQVIDTTKAAGKLVPESFYRRGLLAAYNVKSVQQASGFASGLVRNYPTTQNWGIAITIIREIAGIPNQDMVDLLRLMGRTNSYNETRDYLEYIEAADPRRLPGEVTQILQAGTAAGKLPANDPTVSDARAIASQRLAADKADLPALDKAARSSSSTAITALASGDAFLSHGEPAKAEGLYQIALGKPGVDQLRALTRLGIAQVDQGKYAEAQATFAKITTGPRKPIADLWSAYAASKAGPATATAAPAAR